jgi:DNA-binding transcriptional LysR family regulator
MGRIMASARGAAGPLAWLEPVFTSHVASVLQTMCEAGRGVAWLPERSIGAAMAAGTLVRAGDAAWNIPVEIRLYRPRAAQSALAETVWQVAAGT